LNLVQNFQALSSSAQQLRLSWDHPIDDNYNALIDIDILSIGANSITISAPLNVEAGYYIYQGPNIYTVTARGVQVTTISINTTTNLTTGAALLKVTTQTIIQRRKDSFPVELATGRVFTQNVAVEIFNSTEMLGYGNASVINGVNFLTDPNANFTINQLGCILRDSASYNFTITAVISPTQLQLQSNQTLHNGVYVILSDFSQSNPVTINPTNYTMVTSAAGVITDPNGFLIDPVNNIYATDHQLMNRIVVDSFSNSYVILDNTANQIFINNTTAVPNVSIYPGYTILQPFNGINEGLFYTDNFLDTTEAIARSGTGLEPNQWYYYTAFTKNVFIGPAGENFATFDNVNSTQSFALSTGNSDFGNIMYNQYWPEVFRLTDSTIDASGNPAASRTGNLQDLMSIFGIQFDELYSLVNTFQLQNAYVIAQPVLTQFSYQLNLPPPDSAIGIDTLRRIANELIDIYRNKGDKISIGKFVRVITTWDITGGTGNFDAAIIDSVPNVTALRLYSSALGILNTRLYGTLTVVDTFTPTSYNPANGVVNIPTSVDLSQVMVNDYLDINTVLYAILGGIQATPVSDGTVLFNNPVPTTYTYNSVTGVIQYSSSVDLSAVNPNDIFIDGAGSNFVIVSVNPGSYNLTIATGQTVNTFASVGGGGSVQEGTLQVQINMGLPLVLGPSATPPNPTATVLRNTPEVNIVPSFTPSGYNAITGFLSVPNSVSLVNVMMGDIFIDSLGNNFKILGGINNSNGSKGFLIGADESPSLATGAVVDRISQIGSGRFLKQLPGVIIPGFFSFREFIIELPDIAMFLPTINTITTVNNVTTLTFIGTPNFGRINGLVGCYLYPNESYPQQVFEIISNTATTITIDGTPQSAVMNDTAIVLTPLNSARFQRIQNYITYVSPYNTLPSFEFISPLDVPI
jgi:hypothetical protein